MDFFLFEYFAADLLNSRSVSYIISWSSSPNLTANRDSSIFQVLHCT